MLSKLSKSLKNRIHLKKSIDNILSVKYFGAKVKDISGPSDREVDKTKKPANPKQSTTASDSERKQTPQANNQSTQANKGQGKNEQKANNTTEQATQTVNRSVSSSDLGKNPKETNPNNTTVNMPSAKSEAKHTNNKENQDKEKFKNDVIEFEKSNVKQVESVPGDRVI